jgi:hypothetical protein
MVFEVKEINRDAPLLYRGHSSEAIPSKMRLGIARTQTNHGSRSETA